MKNFFLLVLLVFSSGCATVSKFNGYGEGSRSNIKIVDSRDNSLLHGVECVVKYKNSNDKLTFNSSEFFIGQNVSFHEYPSIVCKKNGYKTIDTLLPRKIHSGMAFNILWWPGALIDTVSGNALVLKKNIIIKMEKLN